MKILQTISEDEMIAIFLNGELTSTRFGDGMIKILEGDNISKNIIENPNTENRDDNQIRREIFKTHRGYGANVHLFENFPTEVVWKKVLLSKIELQNVKYIQYDYWVELSGGSRLAMDAAKHVLEGKEVYKQSNDGFLKAAEAVKQGATFSDLIFVSKNEESYLVVLEGHLRLTAYSMEIEHLSKEIEVIVGFSEAIISWGLY